MLMLWTLFGIYCYISVYCSLFFPPENVIVQMECATQSLSLWKPTPNIILSLMDMCLRLWTYQAGKNVFTCVQENACATPLILTSWKKTENCELSDGTSKLDPNSLKEKNGVTYYEIGRSYFDQKVNVSHKEVSLPRGGKRTLWKDGWIVRGLKQLAIGARTNRVSQRLNVGINNSIFYFLSQIFNYISCLLLRTDLIGIRF